MKSIDLKSNFDFSELLAQLPNTFSVFGSGVYTQSNVLKEQASIVDYYKGLTNKPTTKGYEIPLSVSLDIEQYINELTNISLEHLDALFNDKDFKRVMEDFRTWDFDSKNKDQCKAFEYFCEYAKWSFSNTVKPNLSLYGRYDVVYNPHTKKIEGIYEFNANTPVMLFETTYLNHEYAKINKREEFNSIYIDIVNFFSTNVKSGKMAFVYHPDCYEDTSTTEVLYQAAIDAGIDAYFIDIFSLDYDHLRPHKPFSGRGCIFDNIFILTPWEEMVKNFPKAFYDWHLWCENVQFFNPPWVWFLSNKVFLAHLSDILKDSTLPFIPTYKSEDMIKFLDFDKYVKKPAVGRMSANIEVFDKFGEMMVGTDGNYSNEKSVYQKFTNAGMVDGKRFIFGVWVVNMEASALVVREFDGDILKPNEESFVPHVIDMNS